MVDSEVGGVTLNKPNQEIGSSDKNRGTLSSPWKDKQSLHERAVARGNKVG
jgi:hypothetical protein